MSRKFIPRIYRKQLKAIAIAENTLFKFLCLFILASLIFTLFYSIRARGLIEDRANNRELQSQSQTYPAQTIPAQKNPTHR